MPMNKKQLQKKGPKGHKLAHITPMEGVILKALGGSGRVNPQTKIRQYDWQPGSHTHDPPPDTFDDSGEGYGADDPPPPPPPGSDDPYTGPGTGGSQGDDLGGDFHDDPPPPDDDSNWSYNPFDWENLGGDRQADFGWWWDEVALPWFEETFGRPPSKKEKEKLKTEHETQGTGSTVATENVTTYEDWDGGVHDTQAGADDYNQGIRDTKFGEIGEYEHGESGTGYESAYEQMLADAYGAAQRGANREIMQLGYDPGTGVTEADFTEQQEWLTGLGTAYEAQNKAMYDAWYAENRAAIDAIDDPGQIANYEWTEAPAYDLDYTGGSGFESGGEYDPDYIPDFFQGYNLEYDPGYKDPNMPAEWGGYGEGEGPEEEGEGEGVSQGVSQAVPMQMLGPKKKTRIKAPTSVGLNPFSSGSAKYR